MMASKALTLTMPDIAGLAAVSRPVVSMWRRRPTVRGERLPFPEPVAATGGVERFDRDQIVEWLRRTGRGNNPEQALDAAAWAVPRGVDREEVVALLCLRSLGGAEIAGTGQQALLRRARDVDPADDFLLREIREGRPTADTLGFVDDLAEASYGPGDALARLDAGPLGRATGVRSLAPDALDLVRAVVGACRAGLGTEGVSLAHGGDATLSMALAADFARLVVNGDGAAERRLRRRAMLSTIDVVAERTSPLVVVASVTGSDIQRDLDRVDELIVDLDEDDLAVIVGPACVLCDELRGDTEVARAETLRHGNLVLAMRLARGLSREAHRQSLAIWVCQGRRGAQSVRVADLASERTEEIELGDVAADVSAALAGNEGRSFRYARRRDLSAVLAGGPVVPRGVRAVQMGTIEPSSYLDRVHAATLVTGEPLPAYDVLVGPAPGQMQLRRRSVAELCAAGQLRLRRGCRVRPEHADPAGTVAVLSADHRDDGMRLDAFDASRLYPRAGRTEPGDVIFAEKPRPVARVDGRGGSLVASPSRILRLGPAAPIGPHTLAAIINDVSPAASEWQTWSIPVLPAGEVERLEAALVATAAHADLVQRHRDAAQRLTTALIQGVAAGAVTLDIPQTIPAPSQS